MLLTFSKKCISRRRTENITFHDHEWTHEKTLKIYILHEYCWCKNMWQEFAADINCFDDIHLFQWLPVEHFRNMTRYINELRLKLSELLGIYVQIESLRYTQIKHISIKTVESSCFFLQRSFEGVNFTLVIHIQSFADSKRCELWLSLKKGTIKGPKMFDKPRPNLCTISRNRCVVQPLRHHMKFFISLTIFSRKEPVKLRQGVYYGLTG